MKNSIHAIIFAFKGVFSWHTMKYTLLSGIVVIGLWSMLGMMFWEYLMARECKSNCVNPPLITKSLRIF